MQELAQAQDAPCVLVRRAGCDVSRDTWESLDNLANGEEVISTFELASAALCLALLRRRRLVPPPRLSPPQALPSMLPAGRSLLGARGAEAALLVAVP